MQQERVVWYSKVGYKGSCEVAGAAHEDASAVRAVDGVGADAGRALGWSSLDPALTEVQQCCESASGVPGSTTGNHRNKRGRLAHTHHDS